MHRIQSLALIAASLVATTVSAAQKLASAPPDTTLCEAMATQLRNELKRQPDASKDGPLSLLSRGDRSLVALPSKPDMGHGYFDRDDPDTLAAVMAPFVEAFNPSNELREKWAETLEPTEVFSLPGSDLHVIVQTGGTAYCQGFTFFQTVKGGQSQLLPDLPPKGERDGENSICRGSGDTGYLARIGGVDAFLEMNFGEIDGSVTDSKYSIRVVPLRNHQWASACRLDARLYTTYSINAVYVPQDGSVSDQNLRTLAPKIVEQHAAAPDLQAFKFGPEVPAFEQESVRTMEQLAAELEDHVVPAFGAELSATQDTMDNADSYPLVLNGHAYLMRIGHPNIGWRVFSDSIVIIYTLKDGKLSPVGTAFVEQSPGELESLSVKSSR